MTDSMTGKIVDLRLSVAKRAPMRVVERVEVTAGEGLAGDRHARAGSDRQILLMDRAVLEELGLEGGQLHENITVEGLSLFGLDRGRKLRLGDGVDVQVGELCDPCDYMDNIQPGLRKRLEGQRGLFVTPLTGGTLRLGDEVSVIE
ncbi:MAG: MOSC domain-containing protein [Dehalococcoidia bacterium]